MVQLVTDGAVLLGHASVSAKAFSLGHAGETNQGDETCLVTLPTHRTDHRFPLHDLDLSGQIIYIFPDLSV